MIPGNRNVKNRVVSIFDTGARPIKKGKQRSPTGFGYKTLIAENGDRVITSGKVYRGNPPDNSLLGTSLENHEEPFGRVPWGIATGKGFGSEDNEELCTRIKESNVPACPERADSAKSKGRTLV